MMSVPRCLAVKGFHLVYDPYSLEAARHSTSPKLAESLGFLDYLVGLGDKESRFDIVKCRSTRCCRRPIWD